MINEGTHTLQKIKQSANLYFKVNGAKKVLEQFKRWEYNAQRMLDANGIVNKSSFYIGELKSYNRALNSKSSNMISTTANGEQKGPIAVTLERGWNHGIGRINGLAIEKSNTNHMIVGATACCCFVQI